VRELVPTHIKGFDEAIGGGVPQGHIVLLRGAAGTMKSTVAYYIAHWNALAGRRAVYVTLEQSPRSILGQMFELGMDVNKPSRNLHFLDLSKGREQLVAASQWLNLSPSAGESHRLEALLKGHIERTQREGGYSILVLDSWDALEVLLEFAEKRLDAFRLLEWLRGLGLTCFLVSEVAPLEDGDGSQEVEYLSDAIVNLRLDLTGPNEFQRRIQCMKMRGVCHSSDFFTLIYDASGFEIARAISGGEL